MKVFEVTKTKEQVQSEIDRLFQDYMSKASQQGISVSPEKEQQVKNSIRHKVISGQATREKLSNLQAPSQEIGNRTAQHLADLDKNVPSDDTEDTRTREVLPDEPKESNNLPAIISKEMRAAGVREIEFMQVKDLPGMMRQTIKRMGSQVFSMFTNTPIDEIAIVANINGTGGPNELADVNAVIGYAKQYGTKDTHAQMNFNRSMPGYEAEVAMYSTTNMSYLAVKDFMGSYVYSWPKMQSKRLRESVKPNPDRAMNALFRISTTIRRELMKVEEILEMSDDDIRGDTGEKPVRALSPEMEKRKKLDQAKIKAERDMSRRAGRSRLRGRGRGTAQADQSFIQK